MSGLEVKRPYEVDVWALFKGGFFKGRSDLWIECKDRKSTIKRKDISDLVHKAKDVYHAAQENKQDFWFDNLMLASTSRFDSDAIKTANQFGVTCIYYDGKKYTQQNETDWQDKNPLWLKEAEVAYDL